MKNVLRSGAIAVVMLALAACGGGGGELPPVFVAEIVSDQAADGDIAFDPVLQTFRVTNGPETLFFGIDDLDPHLPEYRAFLDFPLDGSTGEDSVPADAVILSATLELFLSEVSFATVVPALLDLVPYPVSGLSPQDFNSAPLLFRQFDFFRSDQGRFVSIDVTPFMREAQRLGLSDFQVRFLLDRSATGFGFVGIEDRVSITVASPRLIVTYE
ncbi:MAG: hypothetical protein ACYC7J_14130 [Syntrophales bacterium]